MNQRSLTEGIFFLALFLGVTFMMWKLIAPFWGVLALAGIVAVICYPVYERILKHTYRKNKSLAAFLSVIFSVVIVVCPLVVLGLFLLREALSVYTLFNSSTYASLEESLSHVESIIQNYIPGFSVNISSIIEQVATFIANHLVVIFAGTASTFFFFFVTLIATFYFFRDGKDFTSHVIKLSPLRDVEDSLILHRIAVSIRSVALGSVLVAIIQGVLTSIGLSLFGFERAVLWGSVAAIGALIPGVGTSIVFIPAIIYSLATGSSSTAGGIAIWAVLAVGLIDNLLGPHLMSRGNPLHPFIMLLSVLGGIIYLGPIGFILGPVTASLFMVLLELYIVYLKDEKL